MRRTYFQLGLAVLLLVPAQSQAQQQTMTEDVLRTRLTSIIYRHLSEANAEVSRDGTMILAQVINDAARRVMSDGATAEKVRQVSDSTDVFARKLVEEAIRVNGRVRLGESSTSQVISGICPIYPFC